MHQDARIWQRETLALLPGGAAITEAYRLAKCRKASAHL